MLTQKKENSNTQTAIGREETKYRQKVNNGYRVQKGSKANFEVIEGLIRYWWIFSTLAVIVSALGFYSDLVKPLGAIGAIMGGILAAAALEYFKAISIKGVFSGLEFVTKAVIGAFGTVIMIAILIFHVKSINLYGAKEVNKALRAEVTYQRSVDAKKSAQIDLLLKSNVEAAKALNNGFGGDDVRVASVTRSNNSLVKVLSEVEGQIDVATLLSSEQTEADKTKVVLFGMVLLIEFLALSSIIGMFARSRAVSDGTKEIITAMDKLGEIEANNIMAIHSILATSTEKSLVATQNALSTITGSAPQIAQEPTQSPTQSPSPTPQITSGQKGEIWSNPNGTPALPSYTGMNGSDHTFFKGSAENFTDGYGYGSGTFKVEEFPIVPKKRKKTKIVKKLENFEIVEDISRHREPKTESESEKVGNAEQFEPEIAFDPDFISAEEWGGLSDHAKKIALSHIDLSLFDAVLEVPLIQIAYENGLINTYDEPLLKKGEIVSQYRNLKGGTLQDARDIYVSVMEKLEKMDKIVRRSRYHNRCQGINIGKVTIG